MEYIVILIICIIAILILKIAFQIKIGLIKKINEIGYDKELNEITDILPDNEKVCKSILEQLKNSSVIVEVKEDNILSYYSVIGNKIIIANIKDTFTRIQTIAHECIHSVQDRKMLLFNFVFSNIFLIYFIAISILTILKVINNGIIPIISLIFIGSIYYSIRSYLETDAMTKAPYVAKEYMIKTGKMTHKDLEVVMDKYMMLNKMGIPMTNFQLLSSVIVKIAIYSIIAIIML